MASALLEEFDDHLEQSANGLLLPLPTHPPEVVCGGTDYSSKVQFFRELELKAATRREKEGTSYQKFVHLNCNAHINAVS